MSLVVGGTIAAVAPSAPPRAVRVPNNAPGLSFKISASTQIYPGDTPRGQDDEVMRGRGVAVNNHSRIEFLAFTPTPQGVTTDDYLIGVDSGKAFIQHANTQQFTPANDMFGGPAVVAINRVLGGGGNGGIRGGFPRGGGGFRGGRGGGGGGGFRGRGRGGVGEGFLNQIKLLDVQFKLDKLGVGDSLDGHPTQHYRVTTDYRIVWGDQGFPAHAVTEIWTAALPTRVPNPFEPLVVADQSADGPLIEYALKLRAIRAQIVGTPIKVVTTTALTNVRDIVGFQNFVANDPQNDKLTIVQQTQITGIRPADVDPKLVTIPDQTP